MTATLEELKTKLYTAFDDALQRAEGHGYAVAGAEHRKSAAQIAEVILKVEQEMKPADTLGISKNGLHAPKPSAGETP